MRLTHLLQMGRRLHTFPMVVHMLTAAALIPFSRQVSSKTSGPRRTHSSASDSTPNTPASHSASSQKLWMQRRIDRFQVLALTHPTAAKMLGEICDDFMAHYGA